MSGSSTSRTQTTPLALSPDLQLTASMVEDVAVGDRSVALSDASKHAIDACHRTLDEARERGDLIYGLTTGFGPLADRTIDTGDIEALQTNLVYHLASGTGPPLSAPWARAMMLCRTVCLCRGHSAVRPETMRRLLQWLNTDLAAAVPRYGSVGASGDLTPLSHMALAMMGEGSILNDGRPVDALPVLRQRGIEPVELGDRDGLALVNGTSAMTALAALAQMRARRALRWGIDLAALYAECVGAHRQAFDALVDELRPHPGQRQVANRLRDHLDDSRRLTERPQGVQNPSNPRSAVDGLPQDAYSLRCIPQMLGAVADAIDYHDNIVTTELNSVSDNPLFDPENSRAVHAGNFFGQHIALASDHLNQSMTVVAVLAERQIAALTDEKRSPFPAFLQPNNTGIQSGLMGAQVSASSLIAELRTTAQPLGNQSIPTNADNQDVNPMGTLAALRSHDILDRVFEVLSIHAIALRQAHYLATDDGGDGGFSSTSASLVEQLQQKVEPIVDDRPLAADIDTLRQWLDGRR